MQKTTENDKKTIVFWCVFLFMLRIVSDSDPTDPYILKTDNAKKAMVSMFDEGGKAHHNFFRPTTNDVTIHHYLVRQHLFSSGIVCIFLSTLHCFSHIMLYIVL